ncbi:ORM1-like protein 2 [Tigriopus californicus]|nr:ORM1-like protein 2 [Tigriopus californicus]
MMMPGGHGNENPNTNYMNGRGFWIFYLLVLGGVHIILLSVPVSLFSVAWVWTLTHVGHNAIQFWFLHWMKSHPWITFDQGSNRRLTHWEQIDHGVQYTPTRKFLTILPIMLYILASGYTRYDKIHFAINTLSLASVLIPKLPWFHKVRLFGINKY